MVTASSVFVYLSHCAAVVVASLQPQRPHSRRSPRDLKIFLKLVSFRAGPKGGTGEAKRERRQKEQTSGTSLTSI